MYPGDGCAFHMSPGIKPVDNKAFISPIELNNLHGSTGFNPDLFTMTAFAETMISCSQATPDRLRVR